MSETSDIMTDTAAHYDSSTGEWSIRHWCYTCDKCKEERKEKERRDKMRGTDNFLHDLEEAIGDDSVGAIIVHTVNEDSIDTGQWPKGLLELRTEEILIWDEIKSNFDFQYDANSYCQDCPNVTIWTPTRVISIGEYEGNTRPEWKFIDPVNYMNADNEEKKW